MRAAATCCAAVVLLAGCGSSATKHAGAHASGSGFRVTLNLKSGTAATAADCGAPHHFTRYRSDSRIEFAGTVRPIPTGRWKVKLKIKRCSAGSTAFETKVDATRDKHSGAFSGTLPKLAPGAYFARASLYVDGSKRARSDKRHFSLR